jgi:uncharacterized delta-60 repeat protein
MYTAQTRLNCTERALGCMVIALATLAALAATAVAAPGDLDNNFGAFGKASASFSSFNDKASAVAIQPDGKIIVAGQCFFTSNSVANSDLCIARFTANGLLDSTFGGDGKVATAFTASEDRLRAVALQPDGKIVAVGNCASINICLVRYTATGSLDTSFNGDGKVSTPGGPGISGAASVVVSADGKLIVGGSCDATFCVLRYNPDGSPDTSFSGDGKVVTSLGTSVSYVATVLLQPDDKIVAIGYCYGPPPGQYQRFCAVRYNANGSVDTLFSVDGRVDVQIGDAHAYANDAALQPDGKIVIAGTCDPATGGTLFRFCLARFTTSGALDSTFSTDGQTFTTIGTGSATASAVALQPDGKIVVAGACTNGNSDNDFCLVRYSGSGSIDSSFTTDGRVITPIGSDDDIPAALAIQSDGNIVVVGTCGPSGSNNDFCLARYEGGPYDARICSLDFDGDGKVLATTDMLIGTRVALGMTGSAVINGITFAAHAMRDEWGSNTPRDLRKYLITQCGLRLQ